MSGFTEIDVYEGFKAKYDSQWNEFGYGFELPELGKFEGVEEYGRDKDNPSVAYQVVRHVDSGRHFKVTGSYDSWAGTDWWGYESDLTEVTKQIRTYEVWE